MKTALLAALLSMVSGLGFTQETAPPPPLLAGQRVRVAITEKVLSENRAWRETRKLIDQAVEAGTEAVVFDIQVTGGNPQIALPIAEEVARLKVKTVAYINSSALSGGALFALGCDEIWMAPGSRIGAAPPTITVDKELANAAQETRLAEALAVLKAGARSLSKLKGHSPELAEAFIDRSKEFLLGDRLFSTKGELLVLDADDAAQLIDGKPVLSLGTVPNITALYPQKPLLTLNAALFEKPAVSPEISISPKVSVPAATRAGPYRGKVVVIPVGKDDLITPARFEFMSRTLERCTNEHAEAVIFDLDTPGGLVWETTQLMMSDLQKLKKPSFSFVNPRALSGGAMVAIATDAIYMSPASSVGAATPITPSNMDMGEAERAKMNSAVLSMARTVAKEKGHDFRVIEAMIDHQRGLTVNGEVLCAKGELLTLDAQQASMLVDGKPLFAKAIVHSLDDIKKAEGLKGDVITAQPQGFEQIAIWVTQYASILILIGVAGGYLEMQTPGFGLPGFVSIAAFGLFFFGHYIAGSLVGQETIVVAGVFIIGILLLALELMIFPGTIVPGILGFLFIMVALVYTMSGWEMTPTVPTHEGAPRLSDFSLAPYASGLRNFAGGMIGASLLLLLLARFIPNLRPFRHLVLDAAAGGTLEATPAMSTVRLVKPGDSGFARSALRPYGTVEIDSRYMEAMVEGGYVQSGTAIRVREVQGPKIIVEAVA